MHPDLAEQPVERIAVFRALDVARAMHIPAVAGWRASLGLPADAVLLLCAGPAPPRGERVRVLPTLHEPASSARALVSADVFVHAGDPETFGLAALAALACGVPVVARDAEGMAERVDASVGHAVARPAPAEFADAITDLLGRTTITLRQAARDRALRHDGERVLPGLRERYRRLLPALAERAA